MAKKPTVKIIREANGYEQLNTYTVRYGLWAVHELYLDVAEKIAQSKARENLTTVEMA